jgi:hypothetical protein
MILIHVDDANMGYKYVILIHDTDTMYYMIRFYVIRNAILNKRIGSLTEINFQDQSHSSHKIDNIQFDDIKIRSSPCMF